MYPGNSKRKEDVAYFILKKENHIHQLETHFCEISTIDLWKSVIFYCKIC